ncbi:hypothetical protein Acr_00g0012650 [Actinidia rufa]|uniref:Reverse transcriptase Ty1/copia-type domain-containing protein n=1 Tax=Actinidia rufa TaxID=165716 RepID=A0A7J0DBH9_9ERIC|nr:hypothetical protein Acr_00g0012650 [Actinidia rufa]
MEARLKEDILREAECYGGAIMVIHETDDGQIFDAWEHVSSDVIQTPLDVFRCLECEGFPIKYARVPITDGKAPKSSDFDTLAMNIASASKDTVFVFNCQMGRGRTTTGTVIACLLKLRIDYGRPIRILLDGTSHEEVDGGSSSGEETSGHDTSFAIDSMKDRPRKEPSHAFGINDILLLWKITRLFDNGVECREALDAIIDRCSALQNIRQAVLQYRKVFNQQHVEPRERRLALNRGAEYLERYFRLIAFAAYLGSEAFDRFCGQGEFRMTFKNWLHQRPEVQAMKWSIRLRPGRFFTVPEELRAPQESQHGDAVMEAIVKARNGSVLGKGSILKMYFFPGQRTSSNIQIHGAPHVYKVDGYPVYSMATPTIAGAKEMLAYLDAKTPAEGNVARKVILTDLREEAVAYINGTPFVLRELNKPVDTLKHVGITGPVVEHMEARLKEDILSEIKQAGGRMLLHREEYSPALNQVSVIGYWENIFVDDVKTPAEVYAALKDEGYNIEYRRIPLTREREALASDIDAIHYCHSGDPLMHLVYPRRLPLSFTAPPGHSSTSINLLCPSGNLFWCRRASVTASVLLPAPMWTSIPLPTVISESILDQMVFAAASGSSFCKGKVISRTTTVVEITPSHVAPDFTQLQSKNPKWVIAMTLEVEALHRNNTWQVVPLPPDEKIVGCKWVFSVKFHADGSIERYETRLVAESFTHISGKYCSATFALVAKLTNEHSLESHALQISAGSHLFVSHTGFGGVAYAMAIICIRLDADAKLASDMPRPSAFLNQAFDEEAHKMGDYRDILSLTRVLVCGPKSKADVDNIIERCAGAGHLRDDILCYSKQLQKFSDGDDEHRAYLTDMGIKALRRYFFLITFRSYLYCTSAAEMQFSSWMDARPELGHLCNNLRIDK